MRGGGRHLRAGRREMETGLSWGSSRLTGFPPPPFLFPFLVFHLIYLLNFVFRTQVWLLALASLSLGLLYPKGAPNYKPRPLPSTAGIQGKGKDPDCRPCLLSAAGFNHSAATWNDKHQICSQKSKHWKFIHVINPHKRTQENRNSHKRLNQ